MRKPGGLDWLVVLLERSGLHLAMRSETLLTDLSTGLVALDLGVETDLAICLRDRVDSCLQKVWAYNKNSPLST